MGDDTEIEGILHDPNMPQPFLISNVALLEAVMDLEAGLIHPVSDEYLPQAVPV
jgi:hypothetical protein